ncbi:MAG: adenine deaminase [Omnitrophica WOR_2 bacterium]
MVPLNRFSVPPLYTVTRDLVDVAAGRKPADLVITGGRILSTYSDRILDNKEILVKHGRIAAVQTAGKHPKNNQTAFYDARNGILAPGLIDPHIHVESSMMTVCAYAEPALLNGTTTIFCDSHEIGNVADREGIEWMLEDARHAPLSVFLTVPSTVPSTSIQLETTGGDLVPDKIGAIFDAWPEAVALGEKMDFVPVSTGDTRSHAVIAEALKRGLPVCGHCYGREFVAAYAAAGITDTHEAVDRDIAEDFLEAGLWIFMRAGNPKTPWNSLPNIIGIVNELGVSKKRLCLCTDDRDAADIFTFGMDWCVRSAIQQGIDPATAWSMGSLHPATRYHMDHEVGGLGHSRRADIILLNDALEVQNTWYGGQLVVEDKKVTPLLDEQLENRWHYPRSAYETVKVSPEYQLIPDLPAETTVVNIIQVAPPGITTLQKTLELQPGKSWEEHLRENDLCFLSVVERHKNTGRVGHALLQGFGLKSGAVASSVGHDAHNILVAGENEADMRLAVETIRTNRGGLVIVENGQVKGLVALPIAGLLSDKRARQVREEMERFKASWAAKGLNIAYMGFNLIPLAVIPELRLTDMGMVAVPAMQIIPLYGT